MLWPFGADVYVLKKIGTCYSHLVQMFLCIEKDRPSYGHLVLMFLCIAKDRLARWPFGADVCIHVLGVDVCIHVLGADV